MNKTIIVTDLTRFNTNGRVCLAGVEPETRMLIRPMPYINQDFCEENKIIPGSIISADFDPVPTRTPPHIEDYWWRNIVKAGNATSSEFYELLRATAFPSIATGFEMAVTDKVIPPAAPPKKSIITINARVKLHPGYSGDLQKIRASITDNDGLTLSYLPIADLGFYRFAQKLRMRNELQKLGDFIDNQNEIYVRLGLSRYHKAADGREGYWIQVNGIYTFPDFCAELRSYE